MNKLVITGYSEQGVCGHCGRTLKHCIHISDGRIVGATCLDKKLTKPKTYQGKPFRYGSQYIIKVAKCAQFLAPHKWANYGVNQNSMEFEAI